MYWGGGEFSFNTHLLSQFYTATAGGMGRYKQKVQIDSLKAPIQGDLLPGKTLSCDKENLHPLANEGSKAIGFLHWESAVDLIESHNIQPTDPFLLYVVQAQFSMLKSGKILMLQPK